MPESFSQMVSHEEAATQESTETQPSQGQTPQQSTATESQPVSTEAQSDKEVAPVGSFRQFLSESKFQVSEDIDEATLRRQVAERLHAAAQYEEERNRLAAELQRLKSSQSTDSPAAAQGQPPVQAPPTQQPQVPVGDERDIWSENYHINPADMALVVRNPKGVFEPRSNSEQAVKAAEAMNRAIQVTQQRLQQFASNPESFLSYAEKKILQKIEEKIGGTKIDPEEIIKQVNDRVIKQQEERQREAQIDGWYEQQKDKLFHVSPTGDYLRDPMTGQPIVTETGRRFQDAMNTLRELGVNDELKLINTAWQWVAPTPEQSPPAAPPVAATAPPQQTTNDRDTQQRRFLDREAPLPEMPSVNRGQGRPEPIKKPLSLMDMVAQEEAL